MIPSDLAARLRLLNESVVQPLAPVHEIQSDLPEFALGQRFTARIEALLPDGTFRALVAGRTVTLSLPQSAKPGDSLDLVVTERIPRLVVAHRAGEAPAQPTPATTLSRTGQLISSLLANGTGTAQATPLTRAAPLLAQPPANAAPLVPALQQALTGSGLFYEAHQAQWVAGRYTLEALVREPQGQHSRALAPGSRSAPAAADADFPAALTGSEAPKEARAASPSALTLAPDLQPLVQQQLDTAATQQILWRGEVWPGQSMDWEIKEETSGREGAPPDEPAQWSTTLRLTLPRLGDLTAALRLTPNGVGIELKAAEGTTAALRAGAEALSGALAAAGVPLLALSVGGHGPA